MRTWKKNIPTKDFPFVDGDFVEIFPVPRKVENKVAIAGAVKNPGEFGFKDNMRVKDLVGYAGGIFQQADKSEAEITRVTITPQGPETTRLNIRLFGALNNTAPRQCGPQAQRLSLYPDRAGLGYL